VVEHQRRIDQERDALDHLEKRLRGPQRAA